MKPIRLWTFWCNNWVRIKVPATGTLRLYTCFNTEEGWHSEEEIYYLKDGFVYCESETDGRDCDGRLTRGSVHRKPAISDPFEWEIKEKSVPTYDSNNNLKWVNIKEEGPVNKHEWELVKRKPIYDEYAVAMGY
jgi:hypothetical protein